MDEISEYDRLSPQLPDLKYGFAIAFCIFINEFIWGMERVMHPGSDSAGGIPAALSVMSLLVGTAYFLNCVRTYHYVLTQVEGWKHPITPKQAVRFHFIPIFDLYWSYKWPHEIARFVNWRMQKRRMSGALVGTLILLGTAISDFSATIGLVIIFSAFAYLSRCMRDAFAAAPVPGELHVTNNLDANSIIANQY